MTTSKLTGGGTEHGNYLTTLMNDKFTLEGELLYLKRELDKSKGEEFRNKSSQMQELKKDLEKVNVKIHDHLERMHVASRDQMPEEQKISRFQSQIEFPVEKAKKKKRRQKSSSSSDDDSSDEKRKRKKRKSKKRRRKRSSSSDSGSESTDSDTKDKKLGSKKRRKRDKESPDFARTLPAAFQTDNSVGNAKTMSDEKVMEIVNTMSETCLRVQQENKILKQTVHDLQNEVSSLKELLSSKDEELMRLKHQIVEQFQKEETPKKSSTQLEAEKYSPSTSDFEISHNALAEPENPLENNYNFDIQESQKNEESNETNSSENKILEFESPKHISVSDEKVLDAKESLSTEVSPENHEGVMVNQTSTDFSSEGKLDQTNDFHGDTAESSVHPDDFVRQKKGRWDQGKERDVGKDDGTKFKEDKGKRNYDDGREFDRPSRHSDGKYSDRHYEDRHYKRRNRDSEEPRDRGRKDSYGRENDSRRTDRERNKERHEEKYRHRERRRRSESYDRISSAEEGEYIERDDNKRYRRRDTRRSRSRGDRRKDSTHEDERKSHSRRKPKDAQLESENRDEDRVKRDSSVEEGECVEEKEAKRSRSRSGEPGRQHNRSKKSSKSKSKLDQSSESIFLDEWNPEKATGTLNENKFAALKKKMQDKIAQEIEKTQKEEEEERKRRELTEIIEIPTPPRDPTPPPAPPEPPRNPVAIQWGANVRNRKSEEKVIPARKSTTFVGKMPSRGLKQSTPDTAERATLEPVVESNEQAATYVDIAQPPSANAAIPQFLEQSLFHYTQSTQPSWASEIPLAPQPQTTSGAPSTAKGLDLKGLLEAAQEHIRNRSKKEQNKDPVESKTETIEPKIENAEKKKENAQDSPEETNLIPPGEIEIPLPPLPAAADKDPSAMKDTRSSSVSKEKDRKSVDDVQPLPFTEPPPSVYSDYNMYSGYPAMEGYTSWAPEYGQVPADPSWTDYYSQFQGQYPQAEDPSELEMLGIDPDDLSGFVPQRK